MSETLNKLIDAKIHWIISIAGIIVGLAAAFYGVTTKVAVIDERYTQLERRVQESELTAKQYQVLAQSIDTRLSRIEGALSTKQ